MPARAVRKIPPSKEYAGFRKRLNDAADMNVHVPPLRSGRLVHVRNELTKLGIEVSTESVRKWFQGESIPRHDYCQALAEILCVDGSWLLFGEDPEEPKRRRERKALASGAVNFVAGLMQLDGATIAFPEEGDRYALAQHADLHVVISGMMYPIHVTVAEERANGVWLFTVPLALRNTVPIGVMRLERFNYSVCVITDMAIELGQPAGEGRVEVSARSPDLREITSFRERL